MITLRKIDVRVGARLLLSDVNFHIAPGDRVALVGRNGAGKTTLMRTMAGELRPAGGTVTATGPVGYLAQDPRGADQDQTVSDRVLAARGLDRVIAALRAAETAMAEAGSDAERDRAMRAYTRAQDEFDALGGYAAEAVAAQVTAGVGLPDRVLTQRLGELSGGQRRRVELARILFAEQDTLLLDEPTNHLDADSITWLRNFLSGFPGGLLMISHDVGLVAAVANRVFHVDADWRAMEVYNTGWRRYQADRKAAERRRTRERANAERKAAALRAQAEKMRSHVATAVAARNMARRADTMLRDLEPVRRAERVARVRLPTPEPSGRIPLAAVGLAKAYGEHTVFDGIDLAVDRGSRLVVLGLNGAGKTTLLRVLAGEQQPDRGRVVAGHALRLGYFAQEHDTLDPAATVFASLSSAAPQLTDGEVRQVLGAFLFRGDDADKPTGVLSGGEKTRLALACLVHSGANVLLLDEPTNNLDPVSRDEVLAAVGDYPGTVIMVTHDRGAVEALRPDRVLFLPDGKEDLWNDGYADLVSLA
ncbi:ABC-F family ATP-binding cassette domain-containing protein [Streptomyces tubercidicus]|uniref:ABC-F family ATP-binding cassette domain-containing protein n=1 Tax=Streptomyces tubercidicus TaxID=47759 RepID=UPI002E0D8F62|nr:ATP-binding cassette domain-containing protein [Streptomyces tubercidicus]WSK39378.1 ATP-binding cassette domain-containing protein [Streptomyces tubercidicus]WSX18369.1 ATP-binding cassette domain-containing protein [Streptomyces tubercidicus]WSX24954.1 ATP-binding cassette domain-containing protein [Streptomyces tubercidicus]